MASARASGLYAGLASILFGMFGAAWAEQPERPHLKRKILEERVLADFAVAGAAGGVKALHEQAKASVEGGALVASFPGRVDLPAVQVWAGAADLSKMNGLRLSIENQSAGRVQAVFYLYEEGGGKRAAFDWPLDPGANAIAYPLFHVLREGSDDPLDLSKLAKIEVAIKRQKDDATLKIAKISAVKTFANAEKLRLFDFGDGPAFSAAEPVRSKTLYDPKRGYGLSGKNLKPREWQPEFPLFGDLVEGEDLAFRVDLPDGAYEVQVVAFGTSWQGARSPSYKVKVGGNTVVDGVVTKEKFYSFEGLYYGADIFFDPTKSLFDQYHRKYFEPARFEANAEKGALELQFEGCGPRALWIYPKDLAEEGRAFVEACYAESGYQLWLRHARVREHKQTGETVPPAEADTQRGYQVFARSYLYRVYPNDLPLKGEPLGPDGLNVSCAANEFEPVTFVVRPLKDLGLTKVSYSDLTDGEHKISGAAFECFFVKYFPQHVGDVWYEAVPTTLYPYADRELKKDWNHQLWATLRVPAGTPRGNYKGTVTIEPANGAKTTLPVAVTVYPFDLPKTKTECGMWNNTAFENHQLDAFKDNDDFARKMLDAEARNMAEHGLNSYTLGAPGAKKYDTQNNTVELDFRHQDFIAEAVKKNGMPGRHMITFTNLVDYGLLRPQQGYKEFEPHFNAAVKNILTQIRDWLKARELNSVVQVYDEPRETELNAWNRNRRDSIKYLKLAREVPNLTTMVTLMGDKDGFNRPYTPLISLMDVVSTHSWPGSDDTIFLGAVERIADLWLYNNGFTRFTHGYYLWKSRALGHWQWVYSWECCNAHIPVFFSNDTSAAYSFPGGYLNTLKFEQMREGIDDHRYLELLEDKLAAAPKDDPAAAEARKFLKILEAFLPQYPHDIGQTTGAEAGGTYDESKETTYFDPWRKQLAEYIAALQEKRAAKKVEDAWAMFPQQAVAEQRSVVCKLVEKGPAVDGKGNDEVWKDAPEATGFVNLARGVLAPVQTRVKTVCDGEKIYFLFTCAEPKYGELKAYAINRDEDCWMDDSVEAFLDVKHDKKTYKHIIVNCLGTIQDGDGRDPLWNGEIQTAVQKEKGVWTVEVSATLKSLGADVPKEGTAWGINLCRNRQPAPAETSSWAFVGHSFHNPEGFGTLEFKK
ncbi:MAG: hypothetical protein HY291_08975 [Planctomycetes bacterium]|nr:hypothetical protein [Planctomycetota bacterium]